MKPKILTTLQDYTGRDFVADAVAGVTVALVALPLCIAIAIASGATPDKGITTAIVGGLLVSLLGGSRVQIGGPTGAFIVVVYSIIAKHGYDGMVIATFMAGLILLAGGFLRLGRFVHLVPDPVIEGFTIGIAIIIATSQIKDFLGITAQNMPAEFVAKLEVLWSARDSLSPWAAGAGIAAIVAIIAARRIAPKWPGLFLVVAIMSALIGWLHLPIDDLAARYGAISGALPMPVLPDLANADLWALLPASVTIAFLAAIESLLSAKVADRMIGSTHRSNAEILAQGAANVGSALVAGLPVTGAIARTATNVRAGGKTPVAGIIHALAILLIMLFAAPMASHLSLPVLAAILMVTAWNMAEPARWKQYLQENVQFKILLLITLIGTVFFDLTIAIVAGTLLSLLFKRYQTVVN
jgi:SulP family sulfate permease